jgi:hypothetical protein
MWKSKIPIFRAGSVARHAQLFAQDAPQRIFELRRFAFHVLTQGLVDVGSRIRTVLGSILTLPSVTDWPTGAVLT